MERNGQLHRLLGFGKEFDTLEKCGDLLEKFWNKYRPLHPTHEFYKLVDDGSLSQRVSVPVYMHGDEGTTYKKDGCLVLSVHSAIGAGTVGQKLGAIREQADGDDGSIHTNFAGHALETRFMLAAMLRVSWFQAPSTRLSLVFTNQSFNFLLGILNYFSYWGQKNIINYPTCACGRTPHEPRRITVTTARPTVSSWNW